MRTQAGGFTLIELLVVLAIVAMLLTLAVPRYFHTIDSAKETILVENLRTTRDAIDKFLGDSGRYPDSLEELVDKRYLRALPYDPLLESTEKWTLLAPPGDAKGKVYDLKSSAPGETRLGKPVAEL